MNRIVLLPGLIVTLASGSFSSAQQLKEHSTLPGHTNCLSCLAFSPDGKTLASGGCRDAPKPPWGELKLWDAVSGKERSVFQSHTRGPNALAFNFDGTSLAAVGYEGVILWDLPASKQRLTIQDYGSHSRWVAFGPDGKTISSAGEGKGKLWDTTTGKELASVEPLVYSWGSVFSPDLKTLASPNHQDVDLWDIATGKLRLSLEDHRGRVTLVRFSADGKTVVVGSNRMLDDRTWRCEVCWWDAGTGKLLRTLKRDVNVLRGLSPSPDGKFLALSGGKSYDRSYEVILIDLTTERELARVALKDIFVELLFSPDGRF